MTPIRTSLESYLDELTDPRRDHGKQYPLKTIIILAIIAGANDWVAVERYCKLKRDWLATFLDLSCRWVFIVLCSDGLSALLHALGAGDRTPETR